MNPKRQLMEITEEKGELKKKREIRIRKRMGKEEKEEK